MPQADTQAWTVQGAESDVGAEVCKGGSNSRATAATHPEAELEEAPQREEGQQAVCKGHYLIPDGLRNLHIFTANDLALRQRVQ